MKRHAIATGLIAALLALYPHQASAQNPKIVVGYTATVDFAPGFIAMDQGLFKKRGLDVEFKLVPLNSQLPLQSNRISSPWAARPFQCCCRPSTVASIMSRSQALASPTKTSSPSAR